MEAVSAVVCCGPRRLVLTPFVVVGIVLSLLALPVVEFGKAAEIPTAPPHPVIFRSQGSVYVGVSVPFFLTGEPSFQSYSWSFGDGTAGAGSAVGTSTRLRTSTASR
ncbi:MAG: hypothetical protein ACR2PL_15870 [Dehalococcoidia bacterium]